MNPESHSAWVLPAIGCDPLVDLCEKFDRQWSLDDPPRIEDYLVNLAEGNRAEAFIRLLTIELAYRNLTGETVSEQQYRTRFPQFFPALEQLFKQAESLAFEDSNSRSQSSTLHWDRIAEAVNPAVLHHPQDTIDRYQLVQRIGRGGFGEVWKAIDTELHREVAIKLARSDRPVLSRQMEMLQAEARHAASLRHAGIVPVYDIARTPQGAYIVSEFVDGETLASRLHRGALPTPLAVKFAIQIAEALHHAHLRGLVHRDVKPGNILLRSQSDEALLTDFGLAVTEIDQLRESRSTVGTWWYMSPEQARGESHRVDARSDLYSLGVVFYQMLTGRLPFVADTREAYIDQVLNRAPRPLRTIDDTIDSELELICLNCLAKDVSSRYMTTADFATALRSWSRPRVQTEPEDGTSPRSHRVARWMAAGIVAVVVGVVALLWIKQINLGVSENDGTRDLNAVVRPVDDPGLNRPLVGRDRPIPLMTKQPEMFAWSLGEGREKPLFDTNGQLFAVHSSNARWIATTGQFKRDDFEFYAEVSVKDWMGNVGFIWHLAADPRLVPKNAYRCLGIEYQRTNGTTRPRLRLREFVISQHSYDHRLIEHSGSETSREVGAPSAEWLPLRCRVNTAKITVKFGDENEWIIEDPLLDDSWQPVLESACGITGAGANTRVRKMAVRFFD